jgi:hypothetical protein
MSAGWRTWINFMPWLAFGKPGPLPVPPDPRLYRATKLQLPIASRPSGRRQADYRPGAARHVPTAPIA